MVSSEKRGKKRDGDVVVKRGEHSGIGESKRPLVRHLFVGARHVGAASHANRIVGRSVSVGTVKEVVHATGLTSSLWKEEEGW